MFVVWHPSWTASSAEMLMRNRTSTHGALIKLACFTFTYTVHVHCLWNLTANLENNTFTLFLFPVNSFSFHNLWKSVPKGIKDFHTFLHKWEKIFTDFSKSENRFSNIFQQVGKSERRFSHFIPTIFQKSLWF